MSVDGALEHIAHFLVFFCKAGLASAVPRKWLLLCSTLRNVHRFDLFIWEFLSILLRGFAKCFCYDWIVSLFCLLYDVPEMEPHVYRCGHNTKPSLTESDQMLCVDWNEIFLQKIST